MEKKKNKILAIILSMVVYPGTGHYYIGKKQVGIFIMLAFTLILGALLIYFETSMIDQFKLLAQDPMQALSQSGSVIEATWSKGRSFYSTCSYALMIIWLGAAFDVGRRNF